MDELPILSVVVWLPATAGLILCLVRGEKRVRSVALAASVVTGVLILVLFVKHPGGSGMSFVEDVSWIRVPGDGSAVRLDIHYKLGVDGLSLLLVALTGLLTPLAVLCSWTSIRENAKGFFVSLLFLETGMMGVFCALDLFLFYVFWEAMLIPMALIIGAWGGPRRIFAAMKFVLYTVAGSLLMFAAILYCGFRTGTFDVLELPARLGGLPGSVQIWLFAAFALAFAIKVPVFPLHTWLPDAHVEAPTAGSVLLAGVLLKMGGYGFLRFAIPFFPEAAREAAPLFLVLAVVGIVYGAMMAMAQSDVKKLIAYSSVSHLGFVMLGIFSFQPSAMQGAVMQMVNHGLSTGALFLLVGGLYEKTHRRSIDDFGGLARVMPVTAALFFISVLSSVGLPGLNGFVGEFLVLAGTFRVSPFAAAAGGLGVVLGAVYLLGLYRAVFFGKVNLGQHRRIPDSGAREIATLAPLVVLMFVLGVKPAIVLEKSGPPVEAVCRNVDAHSSR